MVVVVLCRGVVVVAGCCCCRVLRGVWVEDGICVFHGSGLVIPAIAEKLSGAPCATCRVHMSWSSRCLSVSVFGCFVLCLFCFVLVWFGFVWFGLVWFGLVWFGLVWFGLVCLFVCLFV